jgi:hypothetical protein
MDENLLKQYLAAIKHFIAIKKIRFIVGKMNTGMQINVTPSEAEKFQIDLGVVQRILPELFHVVSFVLSNERDSAIQTIRNGSFAGITPEVAVDCICDAIITDQFKRSYFHRVSTLGSVLDSLEAQYSIKPSKVRDITPDIPSMQLVMRTRGATRIDDVVETIVELSVDDIELCFNFFKSIREEIREQTKGTIYYIQETN